MNEYEFEPIRGLPGDLPAGERLLWQGSPSWTRLACDAFHVRAVTGYFAFMLAARTFAAIAAGEAPGRAAAAALAVAPIAAAGVGLLVGLAWLNARTTVYTVTSKRVVLRFGVALTKAINLPFTVIEGGALKAAADGSGDLALSLKAPNKLAFLQLWPHARPWKVNRPQPTLRAIPDAKRVAEILATAMPVDASAVLAPAARSVVRATPAYAPPASPAAAAA